MRTYQKLLDVALEGARSDGAISEAEYERLVADHALLLACRTELAQTVSSVQIHEEVNRHAVAYLASARALLERLDARLGAPTPELRKYKDHPTGKLETAVGAMRFTVTDAHHVYLHSDSSDASFATVRGVAYHANAHLYLEGGRWTNEHLGQTLQEQRNNLYMRKVDPAVSYNQSFASDSARKVALDAFAEAWTVYIAANPLLLRDAELVSLNNEINGAEETVTRLREELAEANEAKDALLAKEEQIKNASSTTKEIA